MRKYHDINTFECEKLRKDLDKVTIGCFLVVFKDKNGFVEPVVMHRFMTSLSSMIAKESLFSLHIRYLTTDERL